MEFQTKTTAGKLRQSALSEQKNKEIDHNITEQQSKSIKVLQIAQNMTEQQSKRIKVSALLDAGLAQKEIAELAEVGIRTVQRLAAAKRAGNSMDRKSGSGTTRRVTDEAFIENLLERIITDPTVSLRQHARELNVSLDTIRRVVAELGFKSFVRRKHQLITNGAKDRRLTRARKLVAWLKKTPASTVKIFTDKKIFTVDQFHNRRNDRWIAIDKDDVQGICTTKHPQQVMVLGVLSSDGKRMPPIFFAKDEKCNAEVYYKLLRYKVLPWLKRNFPAGNYVFQQDGAPAHTAGKVQKFLSNSFADFWPADLWPPSSPDLNPLDYFWWSVIEKEVNSTPHRNVDSLKAKIVEVWDNYPANTIIKACKSFRHRLEAVVAANGSYIEH